MFCQPYVKASVPARSTSLPLRNRKSLALGEGGAPDQRRCRSKQPFASIDSKQLLATGLAMARF